MRKLTAMLVASSLALGAAGIAHANEASKGPGPEHKMMMKEGREHRGMMGPDAMFKELNLTEAQKQQVKDIMKESREKMHKAMQDDRREMHSLIASDTFDTAKAQAQLDKSDAEHKARMLNGLETKNKIYNVLTPEQKKQYNDNFEKRLTQPPRPDGKPVPAE
ncbi:ATP-independent periplasmic protein-refolding chaperone Spy [Pectobacterium aroidearum]|uniref:ATP-independent periplasmic protein-refolding chaperone Spy n=1 Tax=Pectobacterium aroidearum TaxID=1201031 RepID=UPI002114E114|nr:ATP-independent periplasmic protein-refolding chaperone Spy [Pectobacterium aroidearum]UUE44430.1 ATP-independent periplasmic protein-refolding chaperone Spy [Pectobacterium aroidearum]UUE48650.1 ATP-independent periplasmic protein-refolding chaperone Spy [Pectobacterium aroidearum]UUE52854.1 ATP-independent periplasmic protein-refolding chaperone Spy [Pectobacterium aroidearum]UUE58249.1 ATP-independent periplasmic protein-refolding chaperone Spy [Pectobacterium aroidearum]UUE61264.1 ATP-i